MVYTDETMKIQEMSGGMEGFRPTRGQVNDWLKGQVLGVMSTLNETGAPTSATVAFSVTESGELLVGTSETSRKSQNVDGDERVAMTVTNPGERYTVQLEGTARKLAQAAFELDYAEEHYAQRPESLPFKDEPGQTHILITPTHLRFSDCNPHPWLLTEFDA